MGYCHSLRSVLACCVFCLFGVDAIGCAGDDQPSTTSSDTQSPAATSSSNKAGGSAGSAAKERGEVTMDDCLVETLGVFAVRPDGYSSTCVNCLCQHSPRAVALCDDQANICWGLIGCMATKCAGEKDMASANCAIAMCGQFIEGSGLAMAVGAVLQGDACSADCPAPNT